MIILGISGYILLKKDNKYILLLGDIHGDTPYCKKFDLDISKFLDNNSNSNQVLLEEIPRDMRDDEIRGIFEASEHIRKLRDLSITNEKIINFDIRNSLIPFSWEILNRLSSEKRNMTLKNYLKLFDSFFEKNNIDDDLFNKIKSYYQCFKHVNSQYMNSNMYYIHQNHIDLCLQINNINNLIIDWYAIYICLNSPKKSIVHAGLMHIINISYNLQHVYGFEVIEKQGHVEFPLGKNITLCSSLSEKIKKIFLV